MSQHPMNHEDLLRQLERRFDRLEEKLDSYMKESATNDADLKWVKGYIKLSLGLIASIIMAIITGAISLFTGKQ